MAPSGLRRPNDPPLLILVSLADGPKHGHALAKDIEDFAGVTLGPGALYGAITRLAQRGLIEPLGSDDRRRPYQITPPGSAALAEALADMRRVARAGLTRLGLDRYEAREPAPLVPRAWRDRYGEELLALIQDTLDEGHPAWRLRLGVAWGGVRERGRQARCAATASVRRRVGPERWGTALVAGLVCAVVPGQLASAPFPARAWQAVALGALLTAVAVAGCGLAGLVLASGARSPAQVNAWGAYWTGLLVAGLALAVAIGLWAAAATAAARHLTLTPRV